MTAGPARHGRPALPGRSPRVAAVVAAAHTVLERDGIDGLTMHAVAGELGIKAPSLYKHVAGKGAIELGLVAVALAEIGQALHDAHGPHPHAEHVGEEEGQDVEEHLARHVREEAGDTGRPDVAVEAARPRGHCSPIAMPTALRMPRAKLFD